MNYPEYKSQFHNVEQELISRFGRERLEETAFPVYFNNFLPASYLGWSRVFTAQKLLSGIKGNAALDFGSGLGVSLPFLKQNFKKVIACDTDPEITEFMIENLRLESIEVIKTIPEREQNLKCDAIIALDVLEHVENLAKVYQSFDSVTADNGVWIISGPTENFIYKLARRIARTAGGAHVRNIYDVFREIPNYMICEQVYTLPWGLPLFLVGRFRRVK